MTDLKESYGSWGLVAGAAEGLGSAFAHALARAGMGVILVDRLGEPLQVLGQQLEKEYGVPVRLLHLDLAQSDAPGRVMELIENTTCRLLIYNAAYSRVRKFIENGGEDLDRYVEVNVRTPLKLVHSFISSHHGLSDLRKGIVLMGSLAGSWGSRLLAPYGATKAFAQILAESLFHELRQDGFDILSAVVGATSTPGYLSSLPSSRQPPGTVMEPERVVNEILHALGKSAYVVPGSSNRVAYFFLGRILPRRISMRIMDREVARLYRRDL